MTEATTDIIQAPTGQPLKRLRLYDNSRLNNFRRCPRYYLFRDIYDWVPERKSMPLIFGSCWHAGMDVIWGRYQDIVDGRTSEVADAAYAAFSEEWVKNGMTHPDDLSIDEIEELGARTPQTAQEMYYNYIPARSHIFHDPSFEIIEIEKPFAVPLDPNDDSLWYVGRLDKVVSYRSKILYIEHKTTTAYRKNGPFRYDFLDSFSPNSQISGYLYTGHMEHKSDFNGVWVDASLVHKSEHDGFQFIPIDSQFAQIDAWLYETHHWIDLVEANRSVLKERSEMNTPYLAAFAKNTGSCGNYGGCPYADICRAVPNPATLNGVPPLGYKKEHWSPFSEIKLEKLGFTADRGD